MTGQLAAIEIYSASCLSLQWFIPHSGGPIYGQSEQGFAMTQKEDPIRITIPDHAVTGKSMPWGKIAVEILNACDVKIDQEKKCIMISILSGDEDIIKDTLEEARLLPGMSSFGEGGVDLPTDAGNDHAAAASDPNSTTGMADTIAAASNSKSGTGAAASAEVRRARGPFPRRQDLGKSTGLFGHANNNKHLDLAKISKAGASFSASRLRAVTNGSNHSTISKDHFNMDDMLRTLPSNGQSTLGFAGQSSSSGESTEYQKDIGFGGEVYVSVFIECIST